MVLIKTEWSTQLCLSLWRIFFKWCLLPCSFLIFGSLFLIIFFNLLTGWWLLLFLCFFSFPLCLPLSFFNGLWTCFRFFMWCLMWWLLCCCWLFLCLFLSCFFLPTLCSFNFLPTFVFQDETSLHILGKSFFFLKYPKTCRMCCSLVLCFLKNRSFFFFWKLEKFFP